MDISTMGVSPIVRKKENLYLTSQYFIPIYDFCEQRIAEGSQEYIDLLINISNEVKKRDPNAVQRNLPTCCYNCHGLSLASRRGWLNDVEIALKNDSYYMLQANENILPGDLVAYSDIDKGEFHITHTGLVTFVGPDAKTSEVISGIKDCTIVSKWGMWGEYIHHLLRCPYTENTTTVRIEFYRFIRTCY